MKRDRIITLIVDALAKNRKYELLRVSTLALIKDNAIIRSRALGAIYI